MPSRPTNPPTPGMVDPRDLTTTNPQPNGALVPPIPSEGSKPMRKSPRTRTEPNAVRSPSPKGALSRIPKSAANHPRPKTRGGTGPR